MAASFAGRGVTALGTAGFIEPAGLKRFATAADIGRDAGLQIVSHAGQTGGPDSIREALNGCLRPHPIAALEVIEVDDAFHA
ncbi:MAG TPA: adenosine deaminase, partial [Gemmatimonadetes bacterium]|nr:adenosine deaminase [Gemmatimonadota bacterium]